MIPVRIVPPNPDKGWARGAQFIRNAVVIPPFGASPVQPTGVYAAPTRFIQMSLCFRDDAAFTKPPDFQPPEDHVPGLHLWCGILQPHFGHFLCEGVARYWMAARAPVQSLVFVARRPGKLEEIKDFHRKITDLFGIKVPIRVVTKTTEFEHMIVPGPGFGLGEIARGTPEFRAFTAANFARDIPAGPPGKLYISRTGLPVDAGGILLEGVLERNLKGAGYEIWNPETLPLEEQISRLKGASEILGLDGSPFHLLGLVGNPAQKVGLILRRNSFDRDNILRQLISFCGQSPVLIDAVKAHWVPDGHYWARGMLNFGELDFAVIRDQLRAAGFIDADQPWDVPPDRRVQSSVTWLAKKAGRGLMKIGRDEDPVQVRKGLRTGEGAGAVEADIPPAPDDDID